MRNLKRTLSMLLAVVMVLGLMVVGAGAVSLDDFSDRDEIVNDEAVLVLTTLNVINGKDNGTYDPAGTVTRGEMAKMICVILNGGADPVLAETVNNSYTDTVGHWAAPYIEYCTALGIVAGRGDKKFDPDGEVSVAEAGKMLLVTLGYNAEVEGYVGANWQINTDVRANQLDIYDGMEGMNTSTILTRDNAALMCYNALDVHMVVYDYIITGNPDNAISTKPQLNDSKLGTLLWEKFGTAKVTGVVVGNEFSNMENNKTDTDRAPSTTTVGGALDAGKTRMIVTNYKDGQTLYQNQAYTFNISTGEDVLGKAVNLYVKPAKDSTNTNRATVIGSAIINEDNNIIVDASGDKLTDVLDDNNLTMDVDAQSAYNYANLKAVDNGGLAGKDGMKGIVRTIIDVDGDNRVDYVLYREMRLGKVTLRSEANDGQLVVAVDSGNYVTKDKDDIAGFDEVAQDDYVLTAYFGGVLHVQQAETITGKINAYKQTDKSPFTGDTYRTTDFTIDGENYSVSRVLTYTSDITAAIREVDKSILSSDATFYLDENGNVIAYGEVDENAYKYVLVWGAEAGTNITSDRVKVTREDGTTATYTVNSNSEVDIVKDSEAPSVRAGAKPADNPAKITESDSVGMVFGYTITSNGEIKLYLTKGGALTADKAPKFSKGLTSIRFTGATITTGTTATSDAAFMSPSDKNLSTGTTTYYSNNATTFFYVKYKVGTTDIDKVSVYNGRNNAPSVDGAGGTNVSSVLALNAKGDVGAAAFFDVNVTESAEDHLFVYKANFVSEDYVTVDTFMNGAVEPTKDVKAALHENNEIVHNPNVKAGIYLYKVNSDGNYEITKPTNANQPYYFEGTVSRINKGNNTFVLNTANGAEEFRLDSKSIVIDYDSDNSNPVAVAGGTVNQNDIIEVIVNNTDDHVVLMVAIMDRSESGTGDTSGVSMSWNGSKPTNVVEVRDTGSSKTEDDIWAAFDNGQDAYIDGNYKPASNLTIPAGRSLYVTGNVDTTDAKCVLTNNGSLFVHGNLTTDAGDNASRTAASVLEVHNDWTSSGAAVTTNGTVRVGKTLNTTSQDLTIASGSKVYTGKIDVGTGILTVNGHAEANGSSPAASGSPVNGDVVADQVVVNSSDSLIVKNHLNVRTSITVGSTARGRIEAGQVTVPTLTMTEGSLTVTSNTLTVSSALTFGTKSATVTAKSGLALTDATTIPANATVDVTGTLTASGNITVAGGSLEADTANLNGNTLTITGAASVDVPTVTNGTVDASGANGGSVNAGTSANSTTTLSGKIKSSATYDGAVTIAADAEVQAGVTITFNGAVTNAENLKGVDGARVKFGSSATVTISSSNKFFGNHADKDTMAALDAEHVAGTTFIYRNARFEAESGNGAYNYSTAATASAVRDSASIYG